MKLSIKNRWLGARSLPLSVQSRWYPWVVVLMSSLFLFYKYVVQVSPSVMTQELMHHFHLNALGLGNLAACYSYSYFAVQLLVGPLMDRYSARGLSTMALLLMSVSLFGFSQGHALWQAVFYRGAMGVGAAFATVSYLKLTANWFSDRQYSVVAGCLATAASLGAMLGQVPLACSVHCLGWQLTLRWCALLGLLVMSCYGLIVRDGGDGFHNPGGDQVNNKTFMQACLTLLKDKRVWALTLYSGLAWAPMAVFGGLWGNPFLQVAYHVSKTQAASLVSMAFLGLGVGGPLLGWLAHHYDCRWYCMLAGLFCSAVGLMAVLTVPLLSPVFAAVSLFIMGFGTGAFMLGFALGRTWFNASLAATMVALVNSGDALLSAVTEPLVGKGLDMLWCGGMDNHVRIYKLVTYQKAMVILPVYLLFAWVVWFWLKRRDKAR